MDIARREVTGREVFLKITGVAITMEMVIPTEIAQLINYSFNE